MGMFDTIYFDKPYICPVCQGEIHSVQVKAFENMLEDYRVKDCVGHAEEINMEKGRTKDLKPIPRLNDNDSNSSGMGDMNLA